MNKYSLKLSREVPNAGGYKNMLRVGMPVQADMVNDICICCAGSYEFVSLNSNVLKQALLNSPEFVKNVLGLQIKEIKKVAKKEENN